MMYIECVVVVVKIVVVVVVLFDGMYNWVPIYLYYTHAHLYVGMHARTHPHISNVVAYWIYILFLNLLHLNFPKTLN